MLPEHQNKPGERKRKEVEEEEGQVTQEPEPKPRPGGGEGREGGRWGGGGKEREGARTLLHFNQPPPSHMAAGHPEGSTVMNPNCSLFTTSPGVSMQMCPERYLLYARPNV